MQKVTLGRTGLEVTIAGLGCGGFSRLGIEKLGLDHAAGIVRSAYDNGVTFFDTATVYGTQKAVGQGLEGKSRDSYVLSTKFPYGGKSAEDLTKTLEESLKELRTDYVDIYHLHGVRPEDYPWARDTFLPVMKKAQEEGKIRFLGITEVFAQDTTHLMLSQAIPENLFDVIMVGYNLLNPSAAKKILPLAQEKNMGVLCMFAVRQALANPGQLKKDIEKIIASGQGPGAELGGEDPLGFLTQDGVAPSIMDAAYRFCRHSRGIHVVLTGTSNLDHLKENLVSIQGAPLPAPILERLDTLFGNVDCVSGQ
ncbi:MAG: aldo/keto reductase [Treponema sp.]|nr:aldo/keto reductase [Treponema sp.]